MHVVMMESPTRADTWAVTTEANDGRESAVGDTGGRIEREAWLAKFRPAVMVAFKKFLATAEWPERERFRRRLVQLSIDELSVDEMLRSMPMPRWQSRQFQPERVMLSLDVLAALPEAREVLNACVAITRRAYELYCSEDDEHPELRSDDPALLSAARGDAHLLLCAREILSQNPPHSLGGGSAGTSTDEWARGLNDAAMPAFKNVDTITDYLADQERLVLQDRHRFDWPPEPASDLFGVAGLATSDPLPVRSVSETVNAFVVMPFSQLWSNEVYAFVRKAVTMLGATDGAVHVYRADDIAEPGQITEQIKQSLQTAQVVIADITSVNPNVMWELGYADGLGKQIVILNQDPSSSPFVMADRRQVTYYAVPSVADEVALVRHLRAALRKALGSPLPDWIVGGG